MIKHERIFETNRSISFKLFRGNELQITSNRNTLYDKIGIPNSTYPIRQFVPIYDLHPGFDPLYGEFDTVGIVVSSGTIIYVS